MFYRIDVTFRPATTYAVPHSDGYLLYAALLSSLEDDAPELSEHVHSPSGHVHVSGLFGKFGSADQPTRKLIYADETYDCTIGVVDTESEAIYQSIVSQIAFGDGRLTVGDGDIVVETFEVTQTSPSDLLETAADVGGGQIQLSFQSPTSIRAPEGDITEMYPHRTAVFGSLTGAWNRIVSEEMELGLNRDTVRATMYERPAKESISTHSVVVGSLDTGEEHTTPHKYHGFTAQCTYGFQGASDATMTAATALAAFSEYAGVGSATARGCGSVTVDIDGWPA